MDRILTVQGKAHIIVTDALDIALTNEYECSYERAVEVAKDILNLHEHVTQENIYNAILTDLDRFKKVAFDCNITMKGGKDIYPCFAMAYDYIIRDEVDAQLQKIKEECGDTINHDFLWERISMDIDSKPNCYPQDGMLQTALEKTLNRLYGLEINQSILTNMYASEIRKLNIEQCLLELLEHGYAINVDANFDFCTMMKNPARQIACLCLPNLDSIFYEEFRLSHEKLVEIVKYINKHSKFALAMFE